MSLEYGNTGSGDYLLRDTNLTLWSCRSRSPSMMVLALARADLERAVASAVVADLVSRKSCWCSGTI